MKAAILVVGVVFGVLTVGFVTMPSNQSTQKEGVPKAQAKSVKSIYVCPMHSKVTSAKPGKCPECGMALVKKVAKPPQQVQNKYVCPMHPEVTSDKAGECPKCGMDLKK